MKTSQRKLYKSIDFYSALSLFTNSVGYCGYSSPILKFLGSPESEYSSKNTTLQVDNMMTHFVVAVLALFLVGVTSFGMKPRIVLKPTRSMRSNGASSLTAVFDVIAGRYN